MPGGGPDDPEEAEGFPLTLPAAFPPDTVPFLALIPPCLSACGWAWLEDAAAALVEVATVASSKLPKPNSSWPDVEGPDAQRPILRSGAALEDVPEDDDDCGPPAAAADDAAPEPPPG